MIDYRKYYYIEEYLFREVATRFQDDGKLNAFDFFCIVIWKANRAKTKIAKRLLHHENGYTTLESAVEALTQQIHRAGDARGRLRILWDEWGFRLPMATAILTVLYPDEFTVYDARVCEQLKSFDSIQYRSDFSVLWIEYGNYIEAVRRATPAELRLRDKDRWLWGRSFATQLESNISNSFSKDPADFRK
jgi:hypothetical protein